MFCYNALLDLLSTWSVRATHRTEARRRHLRPQGKNNCLFSFILFCLLSSFGSLNFNTADSFFLFVVFVMASFFFQQGARHPCVELMDSTSQFIANDYDLIRDKSSFQIITGPNMVSDHVFFARLVKCLKRLPTFLLRDNIFNHETLQLFPHTLLRVVRVRTSARWAASPCWHRSAALCPATAPPSRSPTASWPESALAMPCRRECPRSWQRWWVDRFFVCYLIEMRTIFFFVVRLSHHRSPMTVSKFWLVKSFLFNFITQHFLLISWSPRWCFRRPQETV